METFCRITVQPPRFELKLKRFPFLHRRDHFPRVRFSSTLCINRYSNSTLNMTLLWNL